MNRPSPGVYFVGAGPGDPELLTLKARRIIEETDVIIYAGSLVNPQILEHASPQAEVYDSASLSLPEIFEIFAQALKGNKIVTRVHSGDPSIYSALQEQIDWLGKRGFNYEIIPGVSSFSAAAASLGQELTLPGVSQTIILTRLSGRTSVPAKEKLELLAKTQATICLFLSVHLIDQVTEELQKGYPSQTPVAVVQKVSYPEETIVKGTLKNIASRIKKAKIRKTALIIVGEILNSNSEYEKTKLYDPAFSHNFRKGTPEENL